MAMTNEEMIAYIRLVLGDLSTATISDTTINFFITKWSNYYNYPTDESKEFWVIYKTCLDCLNWLIVKTGTTSESSSAQRRREKRGNEEIEVEFSSSSSVVQGYKDLLAFLESNPEYIDPSLGFKGQALIVGGVSKTEVERVKNNPDSVYNTLGIGWPNSGKPLQPKLYDTGDD